MLATRTVLAVATGACCRDGAGPPRYLSRRGWWLVMAALCGFACRGLYIKKSAFASIQAPARLTTGPFDQNQGAEGVINYRKGRPRLFATRKTLLSALPATGEGRALSSNFAQPQPSKRAFLGGTCAPEPARWRHLLKFTMSNAAFSARCGPGRDFRSCQWPAT